MFENPCLIVNPRANGAIVPEIKANWPQTQVLETRYAGHARAIAREQIAIGVSAILVLGGDGTTNEVVNAMGEDCRIPLAVLPGGSGNDAAKTLGWSSDPRVLIRQLGNAQVKMVDLGLVTSGAGKRYFLNVASCGISAMIAKGQRHEKMAAHPGLAYYLETIRAILRYKPSQIQVELDGKLIKHPDCSLLAYANGQYFGSGMKIAPNAQIDDGRLDEIAVSKMGLGFFLRHGLKVYKGTHLELPQVYKMRGRVAIVESISQDPVYIEADGEDAGQLPARFEILPRCLPVLV